MRVICHTAIVNMQGRGRKVEKEKEETKSSQKKKLLVKRSCTSQPKTVQRINKTDKRLMNWGGKKSIYLEHRTSWFL